MEYYVVIVDDVQLPVAAEGEADRARQCVLVRHDHGHLIHGRQVSTECQLA